MTKKKKSLNIHCVDIFHILQKHSFQLFQLFNRSGSKTHSFILFVDEAKSTCDRSSQVAYVNNSDLPFSDSFILIVFRGMKSSKFLFINL